MAFSNHIYMLLLFAVNAANKNKFMKLLKFLHFFIWFTFECQRCYSFIHYSAIIHKLYLTFDCASVFLLLLLLSSIVSPFFKKKNTT